MHISIFTGEPSGDLHGARLARALRALAPGIRLTGAGGTRMREAGVDLHTVSERWGAIGIPEALRKAPGLFFQLRRLERLLRADPPDVLVPIDFGAFHVHLLRRLQGSGLRTVYYIPPGCWSRERRAGPLPFLVDAIATPFAWSAENLRAAGAPARIAWVGHPLLDDVRPTITRAEACARLGLDPARPTLALVPGSRDAELRHLLPVFLAAAAHLAPAPQCLLTLAPHLDEAVGARARASGLDLRLLRGIDYDLVQAADAALVASGTATLELACLGIPMVAAYRASFATWVQYQIVLRGRGLRFFALPNIITDSPLVPERVQQAASPAPLAADVQPLLADTPARRAQCAGFAHLRTLLGPGGAPRTTAQLILEIAGAPR